MILLYFVVSVHVIGSFSEAELTGNEVDENQPQHKLGFLLSSRGVKGRVHIV
jgi:hypothetical protein